jgi:outer membrane biosynthesis protein TonB
MKADQTNQQEEKNKKRGLWITFSLHTVVVFLALLPIMTSMQAEELEHEPLTMVSMKDIQIQDDVDFTVNAAKKVRKGNDNKKSKTKDKTPDPKPEPTPPPPPTPTPPPVVTDNTLENPAVAASEAPSEEPVQVDEAPVVEPTPEPISTPNQPAGKPSDINITGGNTNISGSGGDGGDDDSLQDGVFGRTVKYRPNIKGLTKEKGKIAIKVCVSQEGTIIATKYLPKQSTLTDPDLIARSLRAVRRYKFDVDYTAPKKQWGKLTFVFDI